MDFATIGITLGAFALYAGVTYILRDRAPNQSLYYAAGGALLLFGGLMAFEWNLKLDDGGYVLGAFLPAVLLGLVWSFVLAATALFLPKDWGKGGGNIGEGDGKPPAIEERPENNFVNFLNDKMNELAERLPDPKAAGNRDGGMESGPVPKANETAPPKGGFEENLRGTYESSGRMYLQQFCDQLLSGIRSNLRKLQTKRNEIEDGHYVNQSRGIYQEGAASIQTNEVRDSANQLRKARNKMRAFVESCKLREGERIDFSNRTGWKKLALWLAGVAAVEWAFSAYVLETGIGAANSIQISAIAVAIILTLASAIGTCIRWTRHNQRTARRVAFSCAIAVCTALYIIGIGLLMGTRGALGTTEGIIETILKGYREGFKNIGDFVIMVVNFAAFGVAIYHVMLFSNKFDDYDGNLQDEEFAKDHWEEILDEIRGYATQAIELPDRASKLDEAQVKNVLLENQVKLNALRNLSKDAIAAYGHLFQSDYQKDVDDYQKANGDARGDLVPVPKYFGQVNPIDFGPIAEEIEESIKEKAPTAEELQQAQEDAQAVLNEVKDYRELKARLSSAYKKHGREVIDAAVQDRTPEHPKEILNLIDPEEQGRNLMRHAQWDAGTPERARGPLADADPAS